MVHHIRKSHGLIVSLFLALVSGPYASSSPFSKIRSSKITCSNYEINATKVSVINEDDRGLLSEQAERLGISDAEVDQALKCTGTIICGWEGSRQLSAGAICPPGARTPKGYCKADRIASAGHLFVDPKTNKLRKKLDTCEFFNYAGHRSKIRIEDLASIDPKQDSLNPRLNMRADKVVVRLIHPIEGCNPYDLAASDEQIEVGDKILAMTYLQEGMDADKFKGDEPIVYPCVSHDVKPPRHGGPQLVVSTCDNLPGASGGFALTRRQTDGELVLGGIFTQAGDKSMNGQPLSIPNRNYTLSVGTNADFIQIAKAPGSQPSTEMRNQLGVGVKSTSK